MLVVGSHSGVVVVSSPFRVVLASLTHSYIFFVLPKSMMIYLRASQFAATWRTFPSSSSPSEIRTPSLYRVSSFCEIILNIYGHKCSPSAGWTCMQSFRSLCFAAAAGQRAHYWQGYETTRRRQCRSASCTSPKHCRGDVQKADRHCRVNPIGSTITQIRLVRPHTRVGEGAG